MSTCAYCGEKTKLPAGRANRSRAMGLNIYCNRKCFGLAKRKHKTKTQKVAEKRFYDIEYRRRNHELLKVKKADYFRRTYDPAKGRIERKKRSAAHAEYCRRPEYKRWKCEYDRQLRANKYGPFAEAYMTAIVLNREIKGRMTNEQINRENGTWAKRQERARANTEEATRDRHRASDGG